MSPTLYPASVALLIAVTVSLVLVVPFAAIQYRRRGGLTAGMILLDFLVLLYLIALISYTLLPFPERVVDFCSTHVTTPQLIPAQFVSDILRDSASGGDGSGGVGFALRSPALRQVIFNIALFIPLGMVVRYFVKLPILITALIGLGVSLLIEVTQLTGNWFFYPCAYRLFDVDDLIANTTGALLGALVAPLLRIIPGQASISPGVPRPVTLFRRLLGMVCDWLIVTLGGLTLVVLYLVAFPAPPGIDDSVNSPLRLIIGALLLAAAQLIWTLGTGRTIGETVVRLEPQPPTRFSTRFIRWAVGIGGYTVLTTIDAPLVSEVILLCVVTSLGFVIGTRNRRGLAYLLNRWELQDDRVKPSKDFSRNINRVLPSRRR